MNESDNSGNMIDTPPGRKRLRARRIGVAALVLIAFTGGFFLREPAVRLLSRRHDRGAAAEKGGAKSEACAAGLQLKAARTRLIQELQLLASHASEACPAPACTGSADKAETTAPEASICGRWPMPSRTCRVLCCGRRWAGGMGINRSLPPQRIMTGTRIFDQSNPSGDKARP